MEVLPNTISNLPYLQTLNLEDCHRLKELLNDFSRLTKLRLLNIRRCYSLTCMPKGLGNLTRLCKLSDFMVGDKGSNSSWKQLFDALEDLYRLYKLRGCLNIEIRCPNAKYVSKEDATRIELYPLRSKEHLKAIEFYFKQEEVDGGRGIEEVTRLMKELEPHPNLQYLKVWRYNGVRMGWDAFPSNLVELVMVGCQELECLPCLGNLCHLKVLHLFNLKKLKYIKQDSPLANSSSMAMPRLGSEGLSSCCPSLETRLGNLPMLKGWRRGAVDDHLRERGEKLNGASSSSSCNGMKIRKVVIYNVTWLKWLPMEAFECLENLEIWCDKEVENLGEVEEVFRSCASSLKVLIIHNCSNLKSGVPVGLKHLTALEKLELRNCGNLTLSEEQGEQEEREDSIGIGPVKWSSNFHALRSLKLEGLPQLVNLPDWMQFLPALETLCICYCCGLKSMPAWMTQITSLRNLEVISCSASLERRCKENPPGEDWPYIQHIPNIEFRNCDF